MIQQIKQIPKLVLDLVFPPSCFHCGRVDFDFCEYCLDDLYDEAIPIQEITLPPLNGMAASGIHRGILQSSVQALKYGAAFSVAMPLAQRLQATVNQLDWIFDTLIPVPLHTQRLQERGYNQAKVIADALGNLLDMPVVDHAIERIKLTTSQVGLSRMERQQNVEEAFIANPDQVRHKRLLLIDDVQTTGATLAACAIAALESGAEAVYGLSVTTAQLKTI